MTKRSIHQYRPKGNPDGMPYAPQRDLAYIYTPMLREVFAGLDRENWSDYFRGWLESEGITEDDLGEGVRCFVEAHRMFIRDRLVNSPMDAFAKSGFLELPDPVRIMLFERLGEVVTGGWFIALRDVTMHGHMSPQSSDIAECVAAGRLLARRLSGHAHQKEDEKELQREQAFAEAEEAERALQQSHDTVHDLRRDLAKSDAERNSFRDRLATTEITYDRIQEVRSAGLYKRLVGAIRIAIRLVAKAAI